MKNAQAMTHVVVGRRHIMPSVQLHSSVYATESNASCTQVQSCMAHITIRPFPPLAYPPHASTHTFACAGGTMAAYNSSSPKERRDGLHMIVLFVVPSRRVPGLHKAYSQAPKMGKYGSATAQHLVQILVTCRELFLICT
jgi:hypothetical protein